MRRFLIFFACLLLLGALPIGARGTEEDFTVTCREGSPFLATYRQAGALGEDMACLYEWEGSGGSAFAYRATPGAEPAANGYTATALEADCEVAGRLRAVILGGYPGRSLSELERRANSWLLGRGEAPLQQLQSGEALLATQLTLWSLGGSCQIRQPYSGWKDLSRSHWASFRKGVRSQESLFQQETAYTESNIRGLCQYLENLPPVEAGRTLIADATLEQSEYTYSREADGTYTMDIRISLPCQVEGEDALTLRAQCGGVVRERKVEEAGEYAFSFSGLSAPGAVTVTLTGTQQVDGAYCFQSGATRLWGYAQGAVPVWAQVTLAPDRILRITKTTTREEGETPLANIQFHLYLAATKEQLEGKEVRLSPTPTAAEVEACQNPQSLTAILTTDDTGTASYNFSAGSDPDGVYLVVEQYSAATTGPVEPFYITVPGEDGFALELHLENQRETLKELTLETEAESYCVGQSHLWQLTAALPGGLANARSFVLTDSFPQTLAWEPSSLTVALHTGEGEGARLVEGAHYTLEAEEGGVRFSLTPAGMALGAAVGEEGALVLTFRAQITQEALPGVSILQEVRLEYENAAGIRYSKTAPTVSLTTGGLRLAKQSSSGQGLAGVGYRIARAAGPEEEGVSHIKVEGETRDVVYLEFWPNEAMAGAPIGEVETDEEGVAQLCGLACGTYYLVETHGAPGYRTETPFPVTISRGITEVVVPARFLLPNTGSPGTLALTVLGMLATVAACWLLVWDRRGMREG